MQQPTFEENSDPAVQAAQAAARGYVYAYPPYGYPGQVSIRTVHTNPFLTLNSFAAHDAWYAPSAWPHAIHAANSLPIHAAPSKW